jgi:uncharacterized protein (TIGR00251 family)
MNVPVGDSRTPELPVWARWQAGALMLALHVQPGARRTAVVGPHGQRLKLALQAQPVDGKANDDLLRFLAATLDTRRAALRLAAGAGSREKSVGLDCTQGQAALYCGALLAAAADARAHRGAP